MWFEFIGVYRGNEKIYFGVSCLTFVRTVVSPEKPIDEFLANRAHAVYRDYAKEVIENCKIQGIKHLVEDNLGVNSAQQKLRSKGGSHEKKALDAKFCVDREFGSLFLLIGS
jgi:hypothetical protein